MKSPALTPNTCEGNWLQTDIEELVFFKEDWDSLLNLKMDDRNILLTSNVQKMKFSIKDFFSKYDRIRRKLRIWSHLLKKSLMENIVFV